MEMGKHSEYSVECGHSTAILFIHGILGSPNQFKFLAEALCALSCDCRAILLPGHGGTSRDFYSTPHTAWSAYAHDEIDRMKEKYEKVLLVGHSMGGLFCLQYAAQYGADGIVLINTPLRVKISLRRVVGGLKTKRRPTAGESPLTKAYREGLSIRMGRFYEYPLWAGNFIGLLRIMHDTLAHLPNVRTPVLVMQAQRDESVRLSSARLLMDTLSNADARFIPLEGSYHSYFPPEDQRKIIEEVTSMIQSIGCNHSSKESTGCV